MELVDADGELIVGDRVEVLRADVLSHALELAEEPRQTLDRLLLELGVVRELGEDVLLREFENGQRAEDVGGELGAAELALERVRRSDDFAGGR